MKNKYFIHSNKDDSNISIIGVHDCKIHGGEHHWHNDEIKYIIKKRHNGTKLAVNIFCCVRSSNI